MLVAVVGATFAYFTATTESSGSASSTEIKTANLGGATVTFKGEDSKYELLDYPGGLGVYGSSATIAKTKGDTDTNNYKATYNLQITYTNGTGTDLDWELYVVDNLLEDALDAQGTTICQKKSESGTAGETKYWYADGTGVSEGPNNDSCTGSAIVKKLTDELSGKKLAFGKLKANGSATITKDTTDQVTLDPTEGENLANRTLETNGTKTKYYYLIVKYPNKPSEDQSKTDAGKNINVSLSIKQDSVETTLAE